MAHLSRPAILFEILIILVTKLLIPFSYIFICLFYIARTIQSFIPGDQSCNPDSTAGQNNTRPLCDQEKNKLLDAWSASATSKVLFVTVEVHRLNGQSPEISDIAVSRWSPSTPGIETLHWVIENEGLDAKVYDVQKTSVFLHGTLKTIQADEVSTHMAEIFQDFRKQFERVYFVGYKINEALDLMSKAWALPEDIATIDTERVWKAQHPETAQSSFKQCIERIPELREYSSSLENAGNKAWLGIQLLRDEVENFSLESKVPKLRVIDKASTQKLETLGPTT
ncbi:hypothetical protein F5Y12DRAFT_774773 [Xylaria sp. FL1777]|nr:hypothetical protein F5Y12DRAFT_774773 [Xylaria sp. FL1777]